jgi:hypothetical protein
MKENRKVYDWLVRNGNAAVGSLLMLADTMGGEYYCGNLPWQSSLTLLFPDKSTTVVEAAIGQGELNVPY